MEDDIHWPSQDDPALHSASSFLRIPISLSVSSDYWTTRAVSRRRDTHSTARLAIRDSSGGGEEIPFSGPYLFRSPDRRSIYRHRLPSHYWSSIPAIHSLVLRGGRGTNFPYKVSCSMSGGCSVSFRNKSRRETSRLTGIRVPVARNPTISEKRGVC